MSYSCSDFADSILNALNISVPDESADSPADQADLALAAIERLKDIAHAAVVALHEIALTTFDQNARDKAKAALRSTAAR